MNTIVRWSILKLVASSEARIARQPPSHHARSHIRPPISGGMSKKKTKDDGTPKERKKSAPPPSPPEHAGNREVVRRYYISRRELDIEGYKQELLEKSPSALLARAAHALKASRQFRLYVALQLLAALAGYGQVFFCVGLLYAPSPS